MTSARRYPDMELLAHLGNSHHDAVTTMAGLGVGVVLFAYWILRT